MYDNIKAYTYCHITQKREENRSQQLINHAKNQNHHLVIHGCEKICSLDKSICYSVQGTWQRAYPVNQYASKSYDRSTRQFHYVVDTIFNVWELEKLHETPHHMCCIFILSRSISHYDFVKAIVASSIQLNFPSFMYSIMGALIVLKL